jgi:hypothetical protein
MRVFLGALFVSTGALVCSPTGYAQERETTGPREKELRAAASNKDPVALRELACFLFNTTGRTPGRLSEAIALTKEAAQAGDDIARLSEASFLRSGIAGSPDSDGADRIIMDLITKIREKRSTQFATTMDAAKMAYAGTCAPRDFISWDYLVKVDKMCLAIKGPKPEWCT